MYNSTNRNLIFLKRVSSKSCAHRMGLGGALETCLMESGSCDCSHPLESVRSERSARAHRIGGAYYRANICLRKGLDENLKLLLGGGLMRSREA